MPIEEITGCMPERDRKKLAELEALPGGRHGGGFQTQVRWPKDRQRYNALIMALDPIKAFEEYAEADCTVQFWITDAPAVEFKSLRAAVSYAKDHGGRWQEIEITVHLPREDIVYATEKVHRLIDALQIRGERQLR